MDLFDAVRLRRSVRKFASKTIAKGTLERIADAGRFAPTACGEQPWKFVAVTRRETIQELAALADHGKFMAEAGACIAVFSKETKYYLEDCCAATQNILLAATALGIGSCWVAGDKKPYCGAVAKLLEAPEGMRLVSLIALGHPDGKKAFFVARKRGIDEVLIWEKF
jgi:nitroreductase